MAWSSRLVYLGMFKDSRALNRGWPAKIKGWLAWVTWPKVLLLVAFIEGLWFVVFLKLIKFDKCLKFIKTPIYPEAMALSSCQGWSLSGSVPLKLAALCPLWKQPLQSTAASLLEGSVCCPSPVWLAVLIYYLKPVVYAGTSCLPVSFMSFELTRVETCSSQLSLHIHLRSCHITTCSIFFLSFTH